MIRGIVLGSIFLMAAATPALAFRTEDNAQVARPFVQGS